MDRSTAKWNTLSTFRWWTVTADGCASFKEFDGQINNLRRHCFYFAMMIRCCWWISVLQGNWWTDQELKEKLFLLCDDDLLLLMDLRPSRTFREQIKNRRRKCLYFAMMICCCWWISVLQRHLGTGREHKEKLFILCDDDVFLLIDVRPLNKLMDRWTNPKEETVSTFRWWSNAATRAESFE